MARRRAGSWTTTTRHAWRFPPLGANRAVSRMRWTVPSGTRVSSNSRTAPVVRRASISSTPPTVVAEPTDRGRRPPAVDPGPSRCLTDRPPGYRAPPGPRQPPIPEVNHRVRHPSPPDASRTAGLAMTRRAPVVASLVVCLVGLAACGSSAAPGSGADTTVPVITPTLPTPTTTTVPTTTPAPPTGPSLSLAVEPADRLGSVDQLIQHAAVSLDLTLNRLEDP